MLQFFTEPTFWTMFIPLGFAIALAPKPHIEETEEGRQYGLKSIFFKKVIRIK